MKGVSTMKNAAIITRKTVSVLLCLVLLLTVNLSLFSSAQAESVYANYVTFNVLLYENIVLDKFCIVVYLDGQVVDLIDQGDMLTFGAYLTEGIHELTFAHGGFGSKTRTWKIGYLQDGCTVSCELQTHNNNTEIRKGTVSDANGKKIDVSQYRDGAWLSTGVDLAGKALLVYAQMALRGSSSK